MMNIEKKNKSRQSSNLKVGYILLLPWLIGFFGMYLIPMLMSVFYSFTNYNLLNTPKFIGIDNYIRMFTQDDMFWQALKVTFVYVLCLVPLRLAFALFVACLLNAKHHGLGLYRTAYYIPSIIGGSVAVSVVWKQIFGNKGVIMSLLAAFGIEQKLSFLGKPNTSLFVIGAGRWKIFYKITLPMLTPTIFFNLILQIINGFRVFTETKVITDGGPLNSTLSYVLYLYRRAFNYFDMGYSCALAWVLIAIIGVFTILIFRTQNQWVYYEDGRN